MVEVKNMVVGYIRFPVRSACRPVKPFGDEQLILCLRSFTFVLPWCLMRYVLCMLDQPLRCNSHCVREGRSDSTSSDLTSGLGRLVCSTLKFSLTHFTNNALNALPGSCSYVKSHDDSLPRNIHWSYVVVIPEKLSALYWPNKQYTQPYRTLRPRADQHPSSGLFSLGTVTWQCTRYCAHSPTDASRFYGTSLGRPYTRGRGSKNMGLLHQSGPKKLHIGLNT